MWRCVSTFLIFFLFTGCLSLSNTQVWMGGFSRLDVRPLACQLASLRTQQVETVTLCKDGKSMTFESVFSADTEGVTWILMVPTMRALTLTIQPDGAWTIKTPQDADLPPIAPYLILDLAFTKLPIKALQQLLPAYSVEEKAGVRELRQGKRVLLRLENGCVQNILHGYALQFRTIL